MYKLYNDNSLNVLDTFADNSIDAIITDPPYGITHLDKEFNPDVLNNTSKRFATINSQKTNNCKKISS